MLNSLRYVASFTCALLVSVNAVTAQNKEGALNFTPYKIESDGRTIDAEFGRLLVRENRSKPGSNLIELAFVRLKSTAQKPGPPVVYLDGGPGSSPINLARVPDYMRVFLKLREVGDVILLDQRGVGLSRPNLARISLSSLPLDAFESKEKGLSVIVERTRMAAEHFRSQGVDIFAYNSVESANDIEDLRLALGAEKLNLVGFSYGTHLGLSAIRRHASKLNRVAFIGTEGQNHTLKLPSTSQKSLERLSKLAAQDPVVGPKMPDLLGTLKRILDRLEKEPITVRITDRRSRQSVDIRLGKFGFQVILMMDLGDTNDLPVFPALLYTMDKGDHSILAQFAEKRFNQFGGGVSIMSFMMDASSGATRDRHEQILRESKEALLDNAMNFPFPEVGQALGNPDLGDAYRSPINTDVPTLFISGELDNNTPPFQADEVRKTFKQSTHLVVENAGHESMLVEPQVQQAIVDFLLGKDVSDIKLAAPPLRFRPLPEPENRQD